VQQSLNCIKRMTLNRGVVDADVQFVGLAYQQGKDILFR
jgi:hypothetical protein